MRFHQETACGRTSKVCWAVLTIVGLGSALGAAPPEGTETQIAPLSIPKQMPSKPSVAPAGSNLSSPTPTLTPAPGLAPAPALQPEPAPAPVTGPAMAAPVQVYVLNGVDPFGWARLREMSDRLRGSGYDTRYGQWYQSRRFEREIRQLQSQQPGTQVAIVGYSFGVYRAKAMANRLTRDGIPVAMVGYIGGDYLQNAASDVPGGVPVVNVTGNGFLPTGRNLFFNGTNLTGANNLRLPGVRHFDLPKRAETLDALLASLGTSGGTVVTPQPAAVETPSAVVTAPPDAVGPRAQSSTRSFRLVGRGDR